MEEFNFIISAEEKRERLDHFLAEKKEIGISRSQIHKLIEHGLVRINGETGKPGHKIKPGDRIKVLIPPPKELKVKPENIPLEIVYEDGEIIVVNKPKGMVTHPAPGNYSGTLVNALLFHCDHLANLGAPLRPGIVHRLDKDTSGLLVVAKNDAAYLSLVKQMKNRTIEKTYVALVHGTFKTNQGIIEAGIGRHPVHRKKMAVTSASRSKQAITHYKVLEKLKKYTLVEVQIKTGRTHQIRVHMSHIGHPIVGDQTYGKKKEEFDVSGQLLHALKLGFLHPKTGQKVDFVSPLPDEIKTVLKNLQK